MKKLVNDFKILLPNEKYYYFGFVNEATAKKDLNEKELFDDITKLLSDNPNFKIFLFSIKDNKFLGLNLSDQADYSTHFYNLIENKMQNVDSKMQSLESKVQIVRDSYLEKHIQLR